MSRLFAVLGVLCAGWPGIGVAFAEAGASQAGPKIFDLHAGDCVVIVDVPADADPSSATFLLDTQPLTVVGLQPRPYVGRLREPLQQNSELTVTIGSYAPVTQRVGPPATTPPPAACDAVEPEKPRDEVNDERAVFEASGFLGAVFDNFAPKVSGGYETVEGKTSIQARKTFGVEAQYRLFGRQTGTYQLWLASFTLHGVRTSDIDCERTPASALCEGKSTAKDRALEILAHASTMEAHIDPRFEFAALQRDSAMPIKVYATARFGFLDLAGAPRVFNSDSVGVGLIAPSGPFRGSLAQVAWGHSEQFQSNPGWNRFKVFGTLVFDLAPGLKERALGFLSRSAGASRFFIAIAIDRNLKEGPDAVQTYVGMNVDLRHAFGR